MEELIDKIEFYLIFAKSKLNSKYIGHKEAREEIDEILEELRCFKQMKIEDYLSTEEFKTRGELVKQTGLNDRMLRNKISILKKNRPVIYNSQTKRI